MSGRSTKGARTTREQSAQQADDATPLMMCAKRVRKDLRDVGGIRGDQPWLNAYCDGSRGISAETRIRSLVEFARKHRLEKERVRSHARGFVDEIIERVYAA